MPLLVLNNWALIFFSVLQENICFGTHQKCLGQGASNEYPKHMFSRRNKKDMDTSSYLEVCCDYLLEMSHQVNYKYNEDYNMGFHGYIRKYQHFWVE